MDKIFELTAPNVIKTIVDVSCYYGISTQNKQLSLKIYDMEESFSKGFLRMLLCIGHLDAMKIFFI
jgi:hypothetical protein